MGKKVSMRSDKASTEAEVDPPRLVLMRADRFLFLQRPRGISRQALGGANDDKFMQLRRRQPRPAHFRGAVRAASTEIFLMMEKKNFFRDKLLN